MHQADAFRLDQSSSLPGSAMAAPRPHARKRLYRYDGIGDALRQLAAARPGVSRAIPYELCPGTAQAAPEPAESGRRHISRNALQLIDTRDANRLVRERRLSTNQTTVVRSRRWEFIARDIVESLPALGRHSVRGWASKLRRKSPGAPAPRHPRPGDTTPYWAICRDFTPARKVGCDRSGHSLPSFPNAR